MKNYFNILFFTFIIYTLIIVFLYPLDIKQNIYNILDLWLNKVLISLVPMYFLSNILISYPYISKILYPILDKFLNFENERSCSLFLLSIITGNPTSSLLVINSLQNNAISVNEGNRLLKCTVLSSPLFIITMLGNYGYLFIIISILVNICLFYRQKVDKNYKKNILNTDSLLEVINKCPNVMLEILSSMIFITMFKLSINKLFCYLNLENTLFINYILDMSELTTGLSNITLYQTSNIVKLLLSSFLLNFGGFTIIIQILIKMKKTSLSKTSFITSRIIHAVITTFILFIFIFFF